MSFSLLCTALIVLIVAYANNDGLFEAKFRGKNANLILSRIGAATTRSLRSCLAAETVSSDYLCALGHWRVWAQVRQCFWTRCLKKNTFRQLLRDTWIAEGRRKFTIVRCWSQFCAQELSFVSILVISAVHARPMQRIFTLRSLHLQMQLHKRALV